HDRPDSALLDTDRGPVGLVALHAPAGAMHPVHNPAPGTVAHTLKPPMPQMRWNWDPAAPGGRGPAHARLGHRPHRADAAARRRLCRHRPRAGPPSPTPLTPAAPGTYPRHHPAPDDLGT